VKIAIILVPPWTAVFSTQFCRSQNISPFFSEDAGPPVGSKQL
jgi:hypothetical protein